jgi:hypothetical protein
MATTNSGPLGYNVDGRLVPLDQVQNSLGYSHLYPSFNASMETPPSGYRPSFFDYNKPILDEKGNATYDKNGNQQFESAPQYYQPIQQQSYQNYNVDTPYGASQYGKGVQYLQNPFSYAPPGVSYGSQGGMGGMYNPFTYRGGNISASSGMGYGGYGSYGTQTPGAQTGGTQTGGTTPIFGPGGMFPALTGTQTGTQTGTPTGIDALIAAMQAYINGSPTATRISPPTQTSTSTSNPPRATATGFTPGPVVGPTAGTPTNGFVTGPGPSGGFTTGGNNTSTNTNTPATSNYTPSAADNKAFITWWLAQPTMTGKTNAEVIKDQGVTDPYTDPKVLSIASSQNSRANDRANLISSSGASSPPGANIAPWQDPNWQKYQGTNKEAYTTAQKVMTDPAYAAQFSAQTGLTGDNLQSWLLRSTDPAAWNKQAAAASAAAGLVAGPGPSPNPTPTSTPRPDIGAPETITRSGALGIIPDLTNPFTDTNAPTTSPLDAYAMQTYGRPLTDTEKQVLSSMPLTDAQSIMDTSIANYNAAQAAASTPSAQATSSDSSANNMARGGIASLLRRR